MTSTSLHLDFSPTFFFCHLLHVSYDNSIKHSFSDLQKKYIWTLSMEKSNVLQTKVYDDIIDIIIIITSYFITFSMRSPATILAIAALIVSCCLYKSRYL